MAALVKHVLSKNYLPHVQQCRFKGKSAIGLKWSRKKVWMNPIHPDKPGTKIESVVTSIAAKGFLRPLRDYSPPEDAVERCESICSSYLGNVDDSTPISDPKNRFTILNECYKQFNHSVPNSLLYTITTVGALKSFYATPVSTTTPMDKMKTMDLPENLHVQYEPLRFHPDTDTLFGGQSAYPKNSTLVTGLRTRKKYPSNIVPNTWASE